MHIIRTLVLVAFAATALSACMPDNPETQLTWDANTRMTKSQARASNEPARLNSYDNSYSEPRTAYKAPTAKVYAYNDKAPVTSVPLKAPKTYVYQDKYAATAPTPRPSPTSAYAQDGYGATAYGTGGYGSDGYAKTSYASNQPRQSLAPVSGNAPRFDWPISGRVISTFGSTSSGGRNDGINIGAPMGAPIHASASGTVTYAGNELRGYGNLVLIKHAGGYTTAYANADRIVVNKGEMVTRGQIIGYAGQSGDVSSPQLHFEIRRDTTPVDPRSLLASSTASN